MKFVIYIRVSTKHQLTEQENELVSYGLQSQQRICNDYISKVGGQSVALFQDVDSGKNIKREGLTAALAFCKRTGAALVCKSIDRLSRKSSFLLQLLDSKIKVIFAENPELSDSFVIKMLALLAEKEAEMISIRTSLALKEVKKYKKLGNPRPNIQAMVNGQKTKMNAFAKEMKPIINGLKSIGIQSLSAIADSLNNRGIHTRNGNQWYASSVKNLLSALN